MRSRSLGPDRHRAEVTTSEAVPLTVIVRVGRGEPAWKALPCDLAIHPPGNAEVLVAAI
jgi:hypothetical protein